MSGDIPTFIDSGHAHTVYGLGNLHQGTAVGATTVAANLMAQSTSIPLAVNRQATFRMWDEVIDDNMTNRVGHVLRDYPRSIPLPTKGEEKVTRRLVQVFIADPNENVPLEHSLLYQGEQKLTDATDQELFFEIDINSILKEYNAKRVKFIDKKVKERTEHLEPVKIRELKMIVTTVATF